MRESKIGVLCSYVPVEIIQTMHFKPERISIFDNSLKMDNELPSYTCSFVKCLLSYLEKNHNKYDGLILTNSCHAMEALYEIIRGRWVDINVHMINVPKHNDNDSILYFMDQIQKLVQFFETNYHIAFSFEELKTLIRQRNQYLEKIREINDLLKNNQYVGITVKTVQRMYSTNQEEFYSTLLQTKRNTNQQNKKRPRVLIYGNLYNPLDLIETIEACNGEVICLDTCNSFQNQIDRLDETINPIRSLANAYLNKRSCGPQFSIEKICRNLKAQIENYRIDAIIISIMKFCPDQAYCLIQIKEELKKLGYSCLVIDSEYSIKTNGQILTRVEAFFEQLMAI